jgi:signal transduction histidine kinase
MSQIEKTGTGNAEDQDAEAIRDLGVAVLQVVHDIKNQLNGIKLYTSFLRKRLEKNNPGGEELETVQKLSDTVDRAVSDMVNLGLLGKPIELKLKRDQDLSALLETICSQFSLRLESEQGPILIEADQERVSESLKTIMSFCSQSDAKEQEQHPFVILGTDKINNTQAIIECHNLHLRTDLNPFKSFKGSESLRLALAARIIRLHGGRIDLQSNLIRLVLPLQR